MDKRNNLYFVVIKSGMIVYSNLEIDKVIVMIVEG